MSQFHSHSRFKKNGELGPPVKSLLDLRILMQEAKSKKSLLFVTIGYSFHLKGP